MNWINRFLDFSLFLILFPFLLIGAYAIVDLLLVSNSSAIDRSLVELASENNNGALFEIIGEDSEYTIA